MVCAWQSCLRFPGSVALSSRNSAAQRQSCPTAHLMLKRVRGLLWSHCAERKGRCELNRRILIIDDDTTMLETLRAELEAHGYGIALETAPELALKRLA